MDANVFRRLAPELGAVLSGARIDKVYAPAPEHWNLQLSAPGGKRFLCLRASRRVPLLFLAEAKPPNPPAPPARAMWLRKRLASRRLLSWQMDWPQRRLAFALSPGQGAWLVLDLRHGPLLPAGGLDAAFGAEVQWPSLARVLDDAEVWREFPHISPPLRRMLTALPQAEARQRYAALQGDLTSRLYVGVDPDGEPISLTAWPPAQGEFQTFDSTLTASTAYAQPRFFVGLDTEKAGLRVKAERARVKKLKRALVRLDQDARRLEAMTAEQVQAEALQAELWKYEGVETPECVRVEHPEHGSQEIELNTMLSVSENMQRLFVRAAKGRRGLAFVRARRTELEALLEHPEPPESHASNQGGRERAAPLSKAAPPKPLPKKLRGLALAVFTTTDGFTVLRGKNQAAGHKLLSQGASPFDYWLHAAGRPGAHVILKRDHPGQDVPESSLEQAAVLAGLASGYKDEAKADIYLALVKDVRKVKGGPLGLVRIGEVERTLRVVLDSALPERLG